jgi:hypothetical protein
MITYLVAPPILLIVGIPLLIERTWGTGVLGIIAMLLCIAAVLGRWLGGALAGGVVALVNLTLALWTSGASIGVFGAVAFGLALLAIVETVDFAARAAGADVDPKVWRSQIAWWIGRAGLCFGVCLVLVVIAEALMPLLSIMGRSAIAAAGALASFLAALLAATDRREPPQPVNRYRR